MIVRKVSGKVERIYEKRNEKIPSPTREGPDQETKFITRILEEMKLPYYDVRINIFVLDVKKKN